MTTISTTNRYSSFIGVTIVSFVLISVLLAAPVKADSTQIYFLRHAEVDMQNLDKPLTARGRERAEALVNLLDGIKITHIYASHTDRTRDTILPLAKAHGLKVQQFPEQGSTVNGEVVTNRSKGKVATKPLIEALKKVPVGSTVVVGGNSGNLYTIIAELGVRVGTKTMPCGWKEKSCLPCKDRWCFPKEEFHNIWKVTLSDKGVSVIKSQYGEVPAKSNK